MSGPPLELDAPRRAALTRVVAAWLELHPHPETKPDPAVTVRQVEVLRPGRTGVVDILADVDNRVAHAVVSVRRPGEEVPLLRASDESVLGLLEDDHGLGVLADALHDAEAAPLVLGAVTGDESPSVGVSLLSEDDQAVALEFTDRCTLTVFPWLTDGPHPGISLLVALDDAGFNHLAAPVALWRREGRDLGVVQELLAGTAGGWAVALTSLRDLYASGGRPEEAGGDFGPESRALGTMAARMHLALDRAYGRRTSSVDGWIDEAEEIVRQADASMLEPEGVTEAMASLRQADLHLPVLMTHGDFHLGRTARTDQGWVLADCIPGGRPPGAAEPVRRSPLADVADMLWSLHHVATVAAAERDPSGRGGLAAMARSWETRNRRAFLSGYLSTPGIGGLVPSDRDVLRKLAAVFEMERAGTRLLSQRDTGVR
jgi:maltokinase